MVASFYTVVWRILHQDVKSLVTTSYTSVFDQVVLFHVHLCLWFDDLKTVSPTYILPCNITLEITMNEPHEAAM